jgi:hypothetical protein
MQELKCDLPCRTPSFPMPETVLINDASEASFVFNPSQTVLASDLECTLYLHITSQAADVEFDMIRAQPP